MRTLRYPTYGKDVEVFARAAYGYLGEPGSLREYNQQPVVMRRTYGRGKVTLAKRVAKAASLPQYGVVGPRLWAVLDPWIPDQKFALGPILVGGVSILAQDCTHLTTGLGWPAFDTGFAQIGLGVVAPEPLVVYDNTSSAMGGDAFYCRGDSGLEYWVAHISTVPAQGARFAAGQIMTRISADSAMPHVHLAINAVPVLGRPLVSRDNYTHGAPLIGDQLRGRT